MKIFRLLICITILSVISCSPTRNLSIKEHKLSKEIIGSWCKKSSANFSSRLSFYEDSLVTLGSNIDTVFLYRYSILSTSIVLTAPNEQAIELHVLKLEEDILLLKASSFSNLEITYSRCK